MPVHLPRQDGYGIVPRTKTGPPLAGYGAVTMKDALAATIGTLPGQPWRSLTWDRGKELSAHAQFTIETGVPVYVADPHSPWTLRPRTVRLGSIEQVRSLEPTRQSVPVTVLSVRPATA